MKSMVGKVSHFKKGGWRGGTFPFGYVSEKVDGVRKLVINPDESKWVRKIYEWYDNDISTKEIGKSLDKNGVNITIQYPVPVHQQRYFQKMCDKKSLPVTEQAAKNILSLPMYPELGEKEIQKVSSILKDQTLVHIVSKMVWHYLYS